MSCCGVNNVSGAPACGCDWAQALANGANTGGTDPLIDEGDLLSWQDATPVTRWGIRNAPADDDWEFVRFSAAGAETDIPITVTSAAGDVLVPNILSVAGGNPANAAPAAPDMVVGAIEAVNHGLTILTGTGNQGALIFSDNGANRHGVLGNHSSDELRLFVSGSNRVRLDSSAMFPQSTSYEIGLSGTRFARAFFGQISLNVLDIGDASGALDDESYVRIEEPAAGTNTATLPSAVTGYTYILDVVAGAGGAVNLDDAAGDTINGGAGPIALAAGVWLVWAEDATNWRAVQIA